MLDALTHNADQLSSYLLAAQVHTNAVSLHDSCLAIDVDDESRQQVALAVNQSVGIAHG